MTAYRPVMGWERQDPDVPCTHPDGHEAVDVVTMRSDVPVSSLCEHCGARFRIVEQTPA